MKLLPPRVVNIQRSPFNVYIGRAVPKYGLLFTSKWANPHAIGGTVTREKVIALYRKHLMNRPDLIMSLPELSGADLGCFCFPRECHGNVLVDMFEQRAWEKYYTEIPVYDPNGRIKPVKLPFDGCGKRACVLCGKKLEGKRRRWCSDGCVARYELERGYYYRNTGVSENVKRHNGRIACDRCGTVLLESPRIRGFYFGVIPDFVRTEGIVDHVLPLTIGGDHSPGNLQVLCEPCNREKTRLDTILIDVARRLHEPRKRYDFTMRFMSEKNRNRKPGTSLDRWMNTDEKR